MVSITKNQAHTSKKHGLQKQNLDTEINQKEKTKEK